MSDEGANPDSTLDEVIAGLRRSPKQISCKFFYDEEGSRLFDRICGLEEYYPTRTELAILRDHVGEMATAIGPGTVVIELGSGSSLKTPILLDALQPDAYVPIDISCDHLQTTAAGLAERYPRIEILPLCADYGEPVELPDIRSSGRRVVYFPGSTIGNFAPPEAVEFLRRLCTVCRDGGGLLIGVDLVKDTATLERAYDDSLGVTAEFNLNLLRRFNHELGADFDVAAFRHVAFYDADEGRIEMHLESTRQQAVTIGDAEIFFVAGERIHTESSYKYTLEGFAEVAAKAGATVQRVWTDPQSLFSVQYLTVAS